MLSLRCTGKIAGNPVSLRQFGKQYNLPFPLSVIQLAKTLGPQEFGAVIASTFAIPGGQAIIFEKGMIITSPYTEGHPVIVRFSFPSIGCPRIMQADDKFIFLNETESAVSVHSPTVVQQAEQLTRSAFEQRFGLLATAGKNEPILLKLDQAVQFPPPVLGSLFRTLTFAISFQLPDKFKDRQLYDVVVKRDDGSWHIIAPHALYYRNEWKNFGIAHITDLHVAQRIDGFKAILMAAGKVDGANRLINWNDSFRGFIKHANYLHSIGVLDVILATGDLVDYLYEYWEKGGASGAGNMLFLRNLILGKAPGPDFSDVEELRVPIFTVPGNHDYRKYPYYLLFKIDIGVNVKQISNYSGYNINWHEALVFNHKKDNPGKPAELSNKSAALMVEVDRENNPYSLWINNKKCSYSINLGDHRIVMIDSKWDIGEITEKLDGFRAWIGAISEDESAFVAGDPNSEGIFNNELNMVKYILENSRNNAIVIIGMHSPPLNIYANRFSCYFRETQRAGAANTNEIVSFLLESSGYKIPIISMSFTILTPIVKKMYPAWFPKHVSEGYMKRKDVSDFLDHGIARGNTNELLNALTGVGVARKADLLLCGHGHRRVDYRIGSSSDGDIAYCMDFYTENPINYYPFRFHTGWKNWKPIGDVISVPHPLIYQPETDVTYVRITPNASANERPKPKKYPEDGEPKYRLNVPPYANPLSKSNNPKQWWEQHRPLILQTGALGPLDNEYVSFTGFRVIVVKNDVIDKIHYIKMQELRQANYRMNWPPVPPDLSGIWLPEPSDLMPTPGLSLRGTGKITGSSVSIRQLGQKHNLRSPISVRHLIKKLQTIAPSPNRPPV